MNERLPFSLQTAVLVELMDGAMTRDEISNALFETFADAPCRQALTRAVGALQSSKLINTERGRHWGTSRYELSKAGRNEAARRYLLLRRVADGPATHARLAGGRFG